MSEKFQRPENPRKDYLSQLVSWEEASRVWTEAIEAYLGCSIEEAKEQLIQLENMLQQDADAAIEYASQHTWMGDPK